jgi:hypothetical protein
MKCVVEMASDGMIYIPSSIKIGSNVVKGDTHTDRWSHKPIFICFK